MPKSRLPPPSPPPDIPALTGLRFFAAISVAIAHGAALALKTGSGTNAMQQHLGSWAGFGMTLFFVLSGFVIHYNYRALLACRGTSGLASFVWARFARLYPLFIIILLVDLLLGLPMLHAAAGDPERIEAEIRSLPYFLTFTQSWIYTLIGQHSLIYQIGRNAPLTWSISTEWFFYLTYPAIAAVLLRVRRPATVALTTFGWMATVVLATVALFDRMTALDTWAIQTWGESAGIAKGFQDSFVRWMFYFSPYSRIAEFVLGCLTAHFHLALLERPTTLIQRRWATAALAAAVISVPMLMHLMYSTTPDVPFFRKLNLNFGLAPSVAIIIFCCARYAMPGTRWLAAPAMVKLGDASYSIYLVHMLAFGAVPAIIMPTDGTGTLFLLARLAFVLGLIVLISLGLHAVVEAPARSWLRGLVRAGTTRARCLAGTIFCLPLLLAIAIALAGRRDETADVQSGLNIVYASYGMNCGAPRGNATEHMQRRCAGKQSCNYVVDAERLGDPAPGCGKSFAAEYLCMPSTELHAAELPPEAGLRSVLRIVCPP